MDPDRIGTTLNVFMDVWTDDDGELHIDPPPTRAGDRFTIEARVPVVAGITACSAEKRRSRCWSKLSARRRCGPGLTRAFADALAAACRRLNTLDRYRPAKSAQTCALGQVLRPNLRV